MSKDNSLALERALEVAKTRVQEERSKEKAKERQLETRRKILTGAAVLRAVEEGALEQALVDKIRDTYLTAERDRALFGLPPKATGE